MSYFLSSYEMNKKKKQNPNSEKRRKEEKKISSEHDKNMLFTIYIGKNNSKGYHILIISRKYKDIYIYLTSDNYDIYSLFQIELTVLLT
jgi:hypothetical protein